MSNNTGEHNFRVTYNVMSTLRLLMALRRAVYHAQDFHKCFVTGYARRVSNKTSILDDDDASAKKLRPKTIPVPKITLLLPDNSITVTVLDEAQRLAKRRKLSIVKVTDLDSKTRRAVYKLTSGSIPDEEIKKGDDVKNDDRDIHKIKDTKLLYVSATIAENDLLTKTRNIVKLLNRRHKVKILITRDGINGDKTQNIIEDAVKNHGSIQHQPKKGAVMLIINPILDNNKNNSSS